MQTAFSIVGHTKVQFLGSRFRARELREELEGLLSPANELVLDFTEMVSATQSFVDELVGVLILKHGPDIVRHLVFKGCSENIKEIISFVASTRSDDYRKMHHH